MTNDLLVSKRGLPLVSPSTTSLPIFINTNKSAIHHLPPAPLEEPKLVTLRVNHQGDLPRLRKIMAVNEQVVRRKENTKARVSMLPTNNAVVGKLFVDPPMSDRPGAVGEGQRSRLTLRRDRWQKIANFQVNSPIVV